MSEAPHPAHERAADRELVTSRVIAAPRPRVYEAFADPALLARWWGPAGFTSTFESFDLRAGGAWRDIGDHVGALFSAVSSPDLVAALAIPGAKVEEVADAGPLEMPLGRRRE